MTPLTRNPRALLEKMVTESLQVAGELGADPVHPNNRIYRTSDGQLVNPKQPDRGYMTVNALLVRDLAKVVSTSGEDPPRMIYVTVTELGRAVIAGIRDAVQLEAHQTPR